MIKIHGLIILFHISAFTFSQTINIATNTLTIGMDKREALIKMNEFIDQSAIEPESENYWLINNNQIVGSIGFENEKLSYVTTDWDDEIDYLDSINMFFEKEYQNLFLYVSISVFLSIFSLYLGFIFAKFISS